MKKIVHSLLLTGFIFLASETSIAQHQIIWQKTIDGLGIDDPGLITRTFDGGYAVISDPDISTYGEDNFVITKFNSYGIIEWQNTFPGANDNDLASIIQTKDGGYMIGAIVDTGDKDEDKKKSDNKVVTALNTRHEEEDYWIMKMDEHGVILWQKNYGGEDDDELTGVIQTTEGGYLLYGSADSQKGDVKGNHGGTDIWLVKINYIGSVEWKKCYGGSGDDEPEYAIQTPDGGYVIAGTTNSKDKDVKVNIGNQDVWVFKIDHSGKMIWQKVIGTSVFDELSGFTQTADGGLILTGYSRGTIKEIDAKKDTLANWIYKINSSGAVVWNTILDYNRKSTIFSVYPTIEGGFVIAKYSKKEFMDNSNKNIDSTYYNYFVLYYNTMGVLIGQNDLGMFKDYQARYAEPTNDFGYVLAGELKEKFDKYSTRISEDNLLLLKLKSK